MSAASSRSVEPLERRVLLSAGDPDASFGTGGKVLTDLPASQSETGWAVAVQADGKIVAAGRVMRPDDLNGDFLVARYNANGSLDTTFGGGDGYAAVDFDGRHDVAYDVALAPGNKIVVSGYSAATVLPPVTSTGAAREYGRDFAVARLNADGSLDTSFDGDGRRLIDVSGEDVANDLVVRPDGGMYLVGESSTGASIVALRSDGSFDNAFDGDGRLQPNVTGGGPATAAALDASGRLVIALNQPAFMPGAPSRFFLARFNPNGGPDTTFGAGALPGVVVVSDSDPLVQELAIAPDGKIVAAGSFGAVRVNANGTIDTTFSGDGKTGGPTAWSVAVAPDRSVLIGGFPFPAAGQPFVSRLARFLENGTPDASFNATPAEPVGQVQNGTGAIRAVALTGDGRSVTVGYSNPDARGNTDLVVTRRLANGALDPSFSPGGADGDGIVITDFAGSGTEAIADVLTLPDGKVLALGSHETGGPSGLDLALARYNADGSLDRTFGADGTGVVYGDEQGRDDSGASVLVQSDGKILAAASSRSASDRIRAEVVVFRFNADGLPDTTFGTGGHAGINTVDGAPLDVATLASPGAALALQPDGRILVATTAQQRVVVVRLTPAGALDTTFSIDGGAVTTAMGTAVDIALAPAGKIIVLGTRTNDSGWSVGRLNPDGTRDTSFGITSATGSVSSAAALALGAGGEIFVAGTVGAAAPPPTTPPGTAATPRDVFVARYDVNGRVYPGFGTSRTGDIITNLGGDDVAGDLALLPDGSLVLVGMTRPQNLFDTRSAGDFVVARFAPNGTLDPAFGGGDGITTVDFSGGADAASAVAIDADGRIVAAGQAFVPGRSTDFALARLQGGGPLPPNVTEVSLGSAAFTAPFRAYLDALGAGGAAGYALVNAQGTAGGNPAIYVTQVGIDTVSARLDGSGRPDLLGAEDLRVRGVTVADYGVARFAYDPATRVATWTLAQPIVADRVVVDLNTDADPDYEVHLRADVVGGDADAGFGQTVNALDVADVKRRLNKAATLPPATTTTGYSYTADVNGDGRINALDVAAVKRNLNHRLPAAPFPAGAAEADGPSVTRELFSTVPVLA